MWEIQNNGFLSTKIYVDRFGGLMIMVVRGTETEFIVFRQRDKKQCLRPDIFTT